MDKSCFISLTICFSPFSARLWVTGVMIQLPGEWKVKVWDWMVSLSKDWFSERISELFIHRFFSFSYLDAALCLRVYTYTFIWHIDNSLCTCPLRKWWSIPIQMKSHGFIHLFVPLFPNKRSNAYFLLAQTCSYKIPPSHLSQEQQYVIWM